MKIDKLLSTVFIVVLCLMATAYQVQAQQPGSGPTSGNRADDAAGEIDLTTLLAQARRSWPRGFSLMAESRNVAAGAAALSITPTAAGPGLPVTGGGTLGRLTKWTGFTSSNSAIGDSSIYEDKFGKVGIGTDSPTSRLTVAGAIESSSGGVKFPDGTVQTTAGIAPNQLVLVRDLDNPARQPVQANATCTINPGSGSPAGNTCEIAIFDVPSEKRLVIEYASMQLEFTTLGKLMTLDITTTVGGNQVSHSFPMSSPAVTAAAGGGLARLGQQVRIYADPGTAVMVRGVRTELAGTSHCRFSISGHLVDVP